MPKTPKAPEILSEDLIQGTTGSTDKPGRDVVWNVHMSLNASSVRQGRTKVVDALKAAHFPALGTARPLRYRFDDVSCDETTHCIPIEMTIVYGPHTPDGLERPLRIVKSALRRVPGIMEGRLEAVGTTDGWNRFEPWPEPQASAVMKRTKVK